MRRRTFLATMGAGTLAGCSALGGSSFGRAEDPFENVQTQSTDDTDIRTARAVLGRQKYAAIAFRDEVEMEVEFTGNVRSGGRMDFYLMTTPQFTEYKRQPNIIQSVEDIENTASPEVSRTLEPGRYNVVFDNTKIGPAKPSGEVEVAFEFRLTSQGRNVTTTSGDG